MRLTDREIGEVVNMAMHPSSNLWVVHDKRVVLIAKALCDDGDGPRAALATWRMVGEHHIRDARVRGHIDFKRLKAFLVFERGAPWTKRIRWAIQGPTVVGHKFNHGTGVFRADLRPQRCASHTNVLNLSTFVFKPLDPRVLRPEFLVHFVEMRGRGPIIVVP